MSSAMENVRFEAASHSKTPPELIKKIFALFDHKSSQVFEPGRSGEYPHVLAPSREIDKAKAIVTGKSLIFRTPKRDLFIFMHPRAYVTVTSVFHMSAQEQYHDRVTFVRHNGSAKEGRSSIYDTRLFKHNYFRGGNAGNVRAAIDAAHKRHFG